jgi:hypothetical protein
MIISLFVCLFVLSGIALEVSNHFSLWLLELGFHYFISCKHNGLKGVSC